ncbi:MAG: sugar porter family MFS transporter [Paludibacteraceae bacterium]|nr:sugar porter family MFS transporter [Paludibacteraceae bacterium]
MRNKYFVWFMAAIAATGGLLFGFDSGVISGAIPFMQSDFSLSDSEIENVTTLGLLGAVLGAAFSGIISDKIGRKRVMLAAAIIFFTGAFGCGSASNLTNLMFARFCLGIAIGIASFSTPLYIAEISPAHIRGTLVSMFQLLITVGILAAFVSDSLISDNSNPACWRTMFYVGTVPAIILLVGLAFLPESPRWLISKGREKDARAILEKIEDPDVLESEIQRTQLAIKEEGEQMSFTQTFRKKWMIYPLMIATLIMFFQQAVGINTVIYYGPAIFLKAGFEGAEAAVMASVSIGVVNVLFTILSLFIIDKLGRRKLFFIGMSGMLVTLVLIGCSFLYGMGPYAVVGSMLLYIAFFAVSMGPLGWLIISEVFPTKVRGVGSSIGSLANWGFNALVVWTFFKMINAFTNFTGSDNAGTAYTFFVFTALTVIGMIWGKYFLPETKGVSLEQIEGHWKNGGKPNEL